MSEFHKINICGRTEMLPILTLPSGVRIAFFNLHGDSDLTEYCGKLLAKRIGDKAEVLITAESKGLQLTHVVARELGQRHYAVARKSVKLYMQDGISATVKSITTGGEQTLYLSAHDAALLKGKKVGIVDDVISTGGSLKGLEALVEKAGGEVSVKATVLAEGGAADRKDIIFLEKIPLL